MLQFRILAMQCTNHLYIWIIVYTCLSHVYTEIQISVLVYEIRKHVQNMFVPCLYLDIPTQTSSYMLQTAQSMLSTGFSRNKKRLITGFKPRTFCIPASCLNHYATSIHASMQYLQYM